MLSLNIYTLRLPVGSPCPRDTSVTLHSTAPTRSLFRSLVFFLVLASKCIFVYPFALFVSAFLTVVWYPLERKKKKKVNQGTPVHSKLTQYFWGFFIGIIPSGHPRQCRTVCLQHHSSITGWKFLQCSYRTVVQAVNRQEET